MANTQFDPGQEVWVKATVEYICIGEKDGLGNQVGPTYALIIKDGLYIGLGQNNEQHVVGIVEEDIKPIEE
jgi:hypothetical protein